MHFLQQTCAVEDDVQRSREQRVKREHTTFSIEAAPGDRKAFTVGALPATTLHHQEHVEKSCWTGNFFESGLR